MSTDKSKHSLFNIIILMSTDKTKHTLFIMIPLMSTDKTRDTFFIIIILMFTNCLFFLHTMETDKHKAEWRVQTASCSRKPHQVDIN